MATITTTRAKPMTRGTLARATRCNSETIRYYERIGLMPAPPRSAGGHRRYGEEHLRRLTFICRARELGFTLQDVRELLSLVDGGGDACADVRALTLEHAGRVRLRIADLRKIERVLTDMAARCDDGEVPECPVIDALSRQPR